LDWNEIEKDSILTALGSVPEVGGLLSVVVDQTLAQQRGGY
jgi:hypothetical protein